MTLTEHVVQVRTRAAASAEVREGHRVTYRTDGGFGELERADVHRALEWQRHRLVFEHQPLEDVIEELGRYRTGWMFLRDPSLRNLPVTAVFDTAHPDHVLPAIEESLPIRVVRLTDRIILLYRAPTTTR